MTRYILILTLVLTNSLMAKLTVTIPESWVKQEIPALPDYIFQLHKVTSPNQDAEVMINEFVAKESLDEAVKSYLKGVSESGTFEHLKTSKVEFLGEEARKVEATYLISKEGDKIPSVSYLLKKGNVGVIVAVNSYQPQETIEKVKGWVVWDDTSVGQDERKNSSPSLWENLGRFVVYGAVIFAIITAIKNKRKKSGKG